MRNLNSLSFKVKLASFIFMPVLLLGLAISFFAGNTNAGTITFRAPSTVGSPDNTSNSIVVNKPAVVENGDVLIAQVGSFHTSGHTTVWTAPSGWELIFQRANLGSQHYAFFYKVVTDAGEEPATYQFSKSGATGAMAAIIVPAVGVDNADPVDAAANNGMSASSGSVTFSELTTQTNGAVYIGGGTIRRKQTITYHGDMAAIALVQGTSDSASNDVTVSMGYMETGNAGLIAAQSATLSISNQVWYSYVFALKPASPDTPEAPTVIFTSNPDTITPGATSTLEWSATNAETCTASGAWSGEKDISGTEEVSPEDTSVYLLTCTGEGGETEESATVTVDDTTPPEPGTCPFITQYGITWTFDESYPCGTFANGDLWVTGPVTITDITPVPAGGRNGWEINPMPGTSQPYDNRITGYNVSLQPSLPATVEPGSSIASTISTTDGSDCRPCLQTAAILTVLEEVPPDDGANLFRPAYIGTDKPFYSVDDLQTDLLLSLAPVADTPSLNTVFQRIQREQFDHKFEHDGRLMHPSGNMQDYGAGITQDNGKAILRLSLNDSLENKMPLLVATVQAGIDYFAMLENGHRWPANGGHHSGRKIMILFAGLMLDDEGMLDIGEDYPANTNTFAEDVQTFYTFDNPPFADAPNSGCYQALSEDYLTENGYARYGIRHWSNPSSAAAHGENTICQGGTSTYWHINSPSWVGQTLAAHLYGLVDEWNHQAYFDHLDRRIGMYGFAGTWGSAFNNAMWSEYYASDITPPLRFDGSPSGVLAEGTTEATLSLETDETAMCRYSTTAGSSYSSMTPFSSTNSTSHSTLVTGLIDSSSYTYYIKCQDEEGNTNAADYSISFAVGEDGDPPVISNILVSVLDEEIGEVLITWTTNENSTSQVEYGTTASYGSITSLDEDLTTNHNVFISGLSQNTVYHFRVLSSDASNNETSSPDQTFIINPDSSEPSPEPPPASSGGRGSVRGSATPTVASIVSELVSKIQSLIAQLAQAIISLGGTPNLELLPVATMPPAFSFTQDLQLHDSGEDVRELQRYLNSRGFTISSTGPGSPGQETDYFGPATYNALMRFQASVNISSTGYFGPITRGYIEGTR